MPRERVSLPGAAFALAFIAFATLVPTGGVASRSGFLCLGCGDFGAPDVVVNLLLFLPLGVVLGRAGLRSLSAAGIGLALSAAIELAQVVVPGRHPTLRDVLMNGIGCGLGAVLAWQLASWLAPGVWTRTLLWLAAAGALLATGLTGLLLRFEPPGGNFYGQVVPDLGHLERFGGSVDSATVGGIAVARGASNATEGLRAALRDTVHVRVDGRAGPPSRRLAAILRVVDDARDEALLIGPHREDLVVRVRRRAATWRMDAPEFRFRGALAGIAPGTPLTITFDGTRLGGCASVNGTTSCVGRPRAGATWSLARSFDDAPALGRRLLDLMTLVVLLFPFGLLWRSVPRRKAVAATALLVIAYPFVAWWSGLAWPTAWEAAGAALGLVVGMALHARIRPTVIP